MMHLAHIFTMVTDTTQGNCTAEPLHIASHFEGHMAESNDRYVKHWHGKTIRVLLLHKSVRVQRINDHHCDQGPAYSL